MSFLSPLELRKQAMPNLFPSQQPVFNEDRLDGLRKMITENTLDSRTRQRWNGILSVDNTYIPVGPIDPFDMPSYYDDPEASQELTDIIKEDVTRAVDLGIRWKILGNPLDALAVARILTPWTTIQTLVRDSDSRLIWSNRWPLFIQAAQLISDSVDYTPALKTAMEDMTLRGLALSTARHQTENRAAWGIVLEMASAGFLNDRELMDRAIYSWRELFETDIRNNIPVGEIQRDSNGLHYCNFWLNAMTQAAELARFNGEWLYDFKARDGSTLKGVWETVARWTAYPEEYPYWLISGTTRIQAHVDPLHALWPNADSQKLIDTYTTTQDWFGYRNGMLAYRSRPLYG